MKKLYLLFILICINTNYIFSQSGTFDFESATTSGSPTVVTQTINDVTLTVSSNVNVNSWNFGGYGGTSVKVAYTELSCNQLVLTFSQSVNVASLRATEGDANSFIWRFTPNIGSAQEFYVPYDPGATISFGSSFLGITSITITKVTSGVRYFPVIDNVVIDGSLPVELTSFAANIIDENVILNWQTATEVNNYGFEVQRSEVGSQWEKIGFVEGHGNSNSIHEYSFFDNNVTGGAYLYRLKQIDTDGRYEYSKEIEVKIENVTEFSLSQNFPNPFNPTTKIKYSIPNSENVALKVYDMLGREVKTLVDGYKNAGTHEIDFDATELTSGLYFYKIVAGNYSGTRKMMLVR